MPASSSFQRGMALLRQVLRDVGSFRFQEMLHAFDTNRDGVISHAEWMQGVQGLGVARGDAESMFTAVDADGSGMIEFGEVLRLSNVLDEIASLREDLLLPVERGSAEDGLRTVDFSRIDLVVPSRSGRLSVEIVRCVDLMSDDPSGSGSDPFVTCALRIDGVEGKAQTTKTVMKNTSPEFRQTFFFDVKAGDNPTLKIEAWDYDYFSANDFLGQCEVDVGSMLGNDFSSPRGAHCFRFADPYGRADETTIERRRTREWSREVAGTGAQADCPYGLVYLRLGFA